MLTNELVALLYIKRRGEVKLSSNLYYLSLLTDSPHIVSLDPSGSVSGQVGSRISLTCEADANPLPAYQWVQRLHDQYVIRGNSRILQLDNIIFEVSCIFKSGNIRSNTCNFRMMVNTFAMHIIRSGDRRR